VDTDAICAAIRDVFQDTRCVPEPAGALALAGLKQYVASHGAVAEPMVAIVSGANLNFDRLRFVAERAEVGEQREAVFAVTIPEERGSFRRFCAALGQRGITEFNYRIGNAAQAHIFVGVQTTRRDERDTLIEAFRTHGFGVLDLTDDELAKLHLRHMIGGSSPLARDELLYRFEFPERPGALTRFLGHMHPDWNISLFHYRNQGADYGRILVGIQVPQDERVLFQAFLDTLGYPFRDESENPAYRLLLRG
jgi:threonine dehydratase